MVDRMLGGTGDTPAPNRALTEIEQNVLDSVVKLMLEHLTETWRGITEVQFRIQGRETRPQMLQVTGPNEIVILLAFDIQRRADARGMLQRLHPGRRHRDDGREGRAGVAAHAPPADGAGGSVAVRQPRTRRRCRWTRCSKRGSAPASS